MEERDGGREMKEVSTRGSQTRRMPHKTKAEQPTLHDTQHSTCCRICCEGDCACAQCTRCRGMSDARIECSTISLAPISTCVSVHSSRSTSRCGLARNSHASCSLRSSSSGPTTASTSSSPPTMRGSESRMRPPALTVPPVTPAAAALPPLPSPPPPLWSAETTAPAPMAD